MLSYNECLKMSFDKILLNMREEYGNATAFSWKADESIQHVTYKKFVKHVLKLGAYFDRMEMKGKYIVISGKSLYTIIVAMYAAITVGAVAAMVNFDLAYEDLTDALGRIKPALIVGDEDDRSYIEEYLIEKQTPYFLVDAGENKADGQTVEDIIYGDIEEYVQTAKEDLEKPALLVMTSGSTSRSKMVLLPRQGLILDDLYPTGDQVLVLPVYHSAEIANIIANLFHGCHLCLSDTRRAFRDIQWFRPKIIMAVPMFLTILEKKARKRELSLECLERVINVGAPENLSVSAYFNDQGIFTESVYGATETYAVVGYSNPGECRRGSVGKVGRWNEVQISGQGEVLVKGRSVMLGYLDDPAATSLALEDGWYYTGDIGYIDENGFLYLTGRIKNIIILSNGENVSPEAVEKKLLCCGQIESVVVREDNDLLAAEIWCGEFPEKRIQEEVQQFIKKYNMTVPSYHAIKKIVFRDVPFEKTASGKIKR